MTSAERGQVKRERLLKPWRARVGTQYACVHTGRVGVLIEAYWRHRECTGGDWGVFLTLKDNVGTFTGRPAFVREA